MEIITTIVNHINSFVWSYILIALMLASALYFTFRSRFAQFRMFGEMLRVVIDTSSDADASTARDSADKQKGISSLQAFAISLASRVGTGNLAGVAVAITVGGPGAVFWMWMVALISAASAFVESTLAQLYKRRSGDDFVGGPAYYMESGLGQRWMGILFAVLISLTFGFAFNSVQSNTICGAMELGYGVSNELVGIVLTIVTLIVIFGGIHRVARVSSVVVPFMAGGYLLLALYIVIINIGSIPSVVEQIVGGAFGWKQAIGGTFAGALNEGIKRGLFSNEAGMGSAPNAAATATVRHPVKQGLVQMLGVFVDTMVICSCTAFIILLNKEHLSPELNGIQLTQQSLINEIGLWGGHFTTLAIFLFAFSSILGNYYYGEVNIRFVTSRRWVLTLYRFMVGMMVLFGSLVSLRQTIIFADLMMAFMTICNLVAILLLGNKALILLRDYQSQRRSGVLNPIFRMSATPEMNGVVDRKGIECWD